MLVPVGWRAEYLKDATHSDLDSSRRVEQGFHPPFRRKGSVFDLLKMLHWRQKSALETVSHPPRSVPLNASDATSAFRAAAGRHYKGRSAEPKAASLA